MKDNIDEILNLSEGERLNNYTQGSEGVIIPNLSVNLT